MHPNSVQNIIAPTKQLQSPSRVALKSRARPFVRSAGILRISFNFSRAQVRFLLSGAKPRRSFSTIRSNEDWIGIALSKPT